MQRSPLAQLPIPTAHPSSPSSSPLSSLPDDPDAFIELGERMNQRFDRYTPLDSEDQTTEFLRIFSGFLSKKGAATLMAEVLHLNDMQLRTLRLHLIDAILKPMRTISGETPLLLTSDPSEGEMEVETEQLMGTIESSTRRDQKWLKSQCLKRDGYRCQVSGIFDESSVMKDLELRAGVEQLNAMITDTQCCHILPFYLGSFDEDKSTDVESKAIIWGALYRYFPEIRGIISPETINIPQNAITMVTPLHHRFGSFDFSFGFTNDENTYRIVHSMHHRAAELFIYFPRSMVVSFLQEDSTIPMPSPVLLRVHQIISKILNVSGVARELDAIADLTPLDRRVASDGSTDLVAAIRGRLLICA